MSLIRAHAWIQAGLMVVLASCSRRAGEPAGAPSPERREASTVQSQDIDNRANESIEQMLSGKVAGVVVSRTADGSLAVRIRGATSGYNEEPLYVVDGLAVQPGPSGALTGINPRDVESIKVLKGAAETAMYGSRGANGVILIKTKRAK